jgi:SAM-dependent methyltransferase
MKLIYNSFDFSSIGELGITETRENEGGPDQPQRAKVTLHAKVELFQRSYDANRQLVEQARAALALPNAVLQWTNDAAGADYCNQTAVCLSHDCPEEWGKLVGDWQCEISEGFEECFRVLKPNGTLIFKWADSDHALSEVLALTPHKPLFGHQTRQHSKTHWVTFLKHNAPHEPRRE